MRYYCRHQKQTNNKATQARRLLLICWRTDEGLTADPDRTQKTSEFLRDTLVINEQEKQHQAISHNKNPE